MTDHTVRVSVASAWQRFHGCELDFIKDVCHGRCCDAPSRPGGSMVTIHRSERAAIEARGGTVGQDGMLVTEDGCTFKDPDTFLCSLHVTPDKPFGCIASPFTLNSNDTLVVRNRYRRLPCYYPLSDPDREDHPPAFVAFRASLDVIFGDEEAERLVGIIERRDRYGTGEMVLAYMPDRSYRILRENDIAKKFREKLG